MKRHNKFLAAGTAIEKVFVSGRYKEIPVYTLTFDVDGLTRVITLDKEEADLLKNSINSIWEKK